MKPYGKRRQAMNNEDIRITHGSKFRNKPRPALQIPIRNTKSFDYLISYVFPLQNLFSESFQNEDIPLKFELDIVTLLKRMETYANSPKDLELMEKILFTYDYSSRTSSYLLSEEEKRNSAEIINSSWISSEIKPYLQLKLAQQRELENFYKKVNFGLRFLALEDRLTALSDGHGISYYPITLVSSSNVKAIRDTWNINSHHGRYFFIKVLRKKLEDPRHTIEGRKARTKANRAKSKNRKNNT